MKAPCPWGAALTLLFLPAVPAAAAQKPPTTIRITSRLVNVDVAVTNRRTGARIDDLHKQNFVLLDDGHPAAIRYFSRPQERDRPFDLMLFVEVDDSIHPVLPNLESKLAAALRGLEPGDEVAVYVYDPWDFQRLQELTADRGAVLEALGRAADLQAKKNQTRRYRKFEAMPNALLAAIRYARQRAGARTAFVVIGSDFNVIPGTLASQVSRSLLAAGVTEDGLLQADGETSAARFMVRAMTLPSGGSARAEVAQYFAEKTGGETIAVRGDDYSKDLEWIIGDVSQRFSLGFVPAMDRLDGRFHKITVRLMPAAIGQGERRLRVRARSGYYATP